MAWSGTGAKEWTPHDVLLSVSEEGELAFWSLEESLVENGPVVMNGIDNEWRCTDRVQTGRKGFSIARCSSTKKSALGRQLVRNGLRGETHWRDFVYSRSWT